MRLESNKKDASTSDRGGSKSTILNCQVSTWIISEINKIQNEEDKCYRYAWSSKNQAPLKEMEQKHKNRWNMRKEIRVKSIRLKIKKRSMERLGHMMRMPDDKSKAYNLRMAELTGRDCKTETNNR